MMKTVVFNTHKGSCWKLLLVSVILGTNHEVCAYNNPSILSSGRSSSSSSFPNVPWVLYFARRGKAAMARPPNHDLFSLVWAYGYRRGEEMWPPTNVEKPVQLKDSFPLGYVIPYPTPTNSTASNSISTPHVNGDERGRITKILGRASRFQLAKFTDTVDVTTPAIVSVILSLMKLVHPTDGWFVIAFTIYVTFLYKWSQQPTSSEPSQGSLYSGRTTILMPALPPQGHVPFLVSNPLGKVMVDSPLYKAWIRIGWISGFVVPISYIVAIFMLLLRNSISASSSTTLKVLLSKTFLSTLRLCGSPIFLFGTQTVSDSIARNLLVSCYISFLMVVWTGYCFFFVCETSFRYSAIQHLTTPCHSSFPFPKPIYSRCHYPYEYYYRLLIKRNV